MSSQDFVTSDVLRLEVETTPTGLTNLIQNPNGDLGGWGWVTPLANSAMSRDASLGCLSYSMSVAGASYFTSEHMVIAAGQYAAACLTQQSASNAYFKVSIEWYSSSKVLLSTSTPSALTAPSASATMTYAAVLAPASTAFMKLRVDLYTSGGANPTGANAFKFENATVSKAATSGALVTQRINLVPNPSFEVGTSGWVPYASSGIETSLSASAAFAFSGTKSLAMVRPNTTGTCGASSAPIPVTGGSDYVGSVYVRSSGTTRTFDFYLAFYTSAGAYISQVSSATASQSGVWNRVGVTGTAPPSAAYARIECSGTSVPAGETHYLDAALLEKGTAIGTYFDGSTAAAGGWTYANAGTRTRTNLCTNPSAETNATGWNSGFTALSTIARVTSPAGADRTACISGTRTTSTGSVDVVGTNPNRAAITGANGKWVLSASVRSAASSRTVTLGLVFFDASGTSLGGTGLNVGPSAVGSWTRYTAKFDLSGTGYPSGTAYVAPSIQFGAVGTGCAVGEVHYVDAVALETMFGSGGGDYFDGAKAAASPYSFAWSGTADASTSTETGPQYSTATQSNLAYVDPVQYIDVLAPTHDIKLVREALNVGTLTATILDASLDPATVATLRPGRRCRLRVYYQATTGFEWRDVFTGRIDSAKVTYDPLDKTAKRARIEMTATDNVALLANQQRTNGVASIGDLPYVLEGCGVPWNVNGSGNQVASATVVSKNENASALDQVALTRDSNLGYAWVDRFGIMQAWSAAGVPDGDMSNYFALTDGTSTPMDAYYRSPSDVDISYNTQDCINEVNVKFLRLNAATGETEEIPYGPYRDETSIATWGVRSAEFTIHDTVESSTDIQTFATAILTTNANPQVTLNSVTIPILSNANDVPIAATVDLYSKLYEAEIGPSFSDLRVTRVEQTITPDLWTVSLGFAVDASAAAPTWTPSPPNGGGVLEGVWNLIGVGSNPAFANSWINYGSGFSNAGYMRKDGIVYFKGLIKNGTVGTGTPFFTLPAGYRPADQKLFPVLAGAVVSGAASAGTAHTHSTANTAGRVNVMPNGQVNLEGSATNTYVSLDGISFPAEA